MAFRQPEKRKTQLLSILLFFLVLSVLQIFAQAFASTPQFTFLGGFLSSLLFFFLLIIIGTLVDEIKWFGVIISLLVALVAAATVHRVCVTTCFLFSLGILFYMVQSSKHISSEIQKDAARTNVRTKPKRT
eukprot:TRINITY_DN12825_c0_g1_i1.p1 TRINITY_DN12825_c0_g1~~TRINITY_DN12825_c0_g1_i1.p1  ORF type:complete len:131 (-),score=26.43 TRINITY_DN12825_c0_g1_i1:72-464(-)